MLKQICEASIRQINAEKEEHEEERRTKRSRGDESSNVSISNRTQGTGNTTSSGDIDGMDHDLAEEGDQNARETFHGMNETFANLKQSLYFLFLSEAKVDCDRMKALANSLNYCYTNDDKYVQDQMNICGLMDIVYTGRDFTWSSNKYGTVIRKSRIDMAIGNSYWCMNFPLDKLFHLVQAGSDHCPILLSPTVNDNPKTWRPFKFFAMWMKHFSFKNQLQVAWNNDTHGSPAFKLVSKKQNTRLRISQWNKIEFGDINRNISNIQTQLEMAQKAPITADQHDKIISLTKNLDEWFDIKTEIYRQKENVRKNIDSLCDANGVWYDNRDGIANLLINHFEYVSKTSTPCLSDTIFDILPTIISNQNNLEFTRIPSGDQIHNTVKHMSAWSSPGPDGFQVGFYQANWDIVGHDVIIVIQSFFGHGFMPSTFNKTYISLIPKTDKAKSPVDFRPIGRAIHDNIIVAHEMIHTMKHKEGSSGTMALKLDLSKAFDRIEWPFLLGILRKFGFNEKFCGYIEQCVSTTQIVILLNGSPTKCFTPSRGVKAARKAPSITHLMFDDDIIIFTKADMHNVNGIIIPNTMIDKMDSIQRHLFWGHQNNRGHCPTGWNKLSIPKPLGGLGFRNLEKFNTAMLTKLAWKACNENDSLCMQIIRAKYDNNGSLLHIDKLKDDCSWLWRSFYSGLEVVQQHSMWVVHSGTKINIWLDNWIIGYNSPSVSVMRLSSLNSYSLVCDLFIPNTRTRNNDLVVSLFNHETATTILNMNVPLTGQDYLIWKPNRKGKFSVKSAYNTLCVDYVNNAISNDIIPKEVWKNLWHMRVPHRVQLFLWKCLKDIVPTREKISVYKQDIESIIVVFAIIIWKPVFISF
ncbi:uncharacterized protein LOC113328067 [Papaver somniferum]|uniref:uncharacterized protein LOC113328067 n=1 Tax=Papaver somniferum TaxID=3469 RepID=UPI000E701F62|nr:uncharacterized protein LOC113328067 [Papaver somniferum]